MATYRCQLSQMVRVIGGIVLLGSGCFSSTAAQQPAYRFEVGAAGSANAFDEATDLGGAAGGLGRFGLWLPLNFSVEGEASFATPKAKTAGVGVGVRTFAVSALYNIPAGGASTAYFKVGVGSTRYNGDSETTVRGSGRAFLLGGGFRMAVSPMVMIRAEGIYNRNKGGSVSLSNYGANLGVSLMLGAKPIRDRDHDGVPDSRDACAGTPTGVGVDDRGCPRDSDADGVPDGVDRCPGTPLGATVDAAGCPKDTDGDNIPDGLDRCPNTPAGVLVDPRGCPRDSDGDGIPDGLDRCPQTPRGATVDAVGCPGDEDNDGVLDGLDRCPRSPPGAVDAHGCPIAPAPSPTPAPSPPAPAPAPSPPPSPRAGRGTITESRTVLQGVGFVAGTARLRPESFVALDSIAGILLADTALYVEIGGHTDNIGRAEESRRLTTLQAEAVRTYLVQKGVPVQRVIAHGYGATRPLTPDTTPRGLARNRRIEIRRIQPGP